MGSWLRQGDEHPPTQSCLVWPIYHCALDTNLTFLLKEMVDVLLPYVTAMINASLREGRLPSSHRHAVVTPLLKIISARCWRAKELPTRLQSVVHFQADRASCVHTDCQPPQRQRYDAPSAVGVQASSQHRDSTRQKYCRTYMLASTNSK